MEVKECQLITSTVAAAVLIVILVLLLCNWRHMRGGMHRHACKCSGGDVPVEKEKEGFYDPSTRAEAQKFIDEGDLNLFLDKEQSGYVAETPLEEEIMPKRDEAGYDGDWGTYISHEGAEPEVHLSHQQYIRDIGPRTRGASNQSIMDHDNDSNWRGVDRRPQYARVKVHKATRETQGEYAHQYVTTGINRHNCGVEGEYDYLRKKDE